MISKEALTFWNAKDFKRQVELIAGPVPWDVSEKTAPYHRSIICTDRISDALAAVKNPTLLELGCGVGRLIFDWGHAAVGVDISENMLKKAREIGAGKKHVKFILTNGKTLDVPDNSVDFVYSFLVFQHIQTAAEVHQYVNEVARILKPGGHFRVQTLQGHPHPEGKFGGFHGRFYPDLDSFRDELCATGGLTAMESDEGLGHPGWLWLTLKKF